MAYPIQNSTSEAGGHAGIYPCTHHTNREILIILITSFMVSVEKWVAHCIWCFFINSTINQCHLVESKMLTWTTASESYLSWIYNLSKNPSLQRRQLIHQRYEFNTALQSPSPSRHLQEPKTHLQHQQELTFRAPERAANSSAVTQNMGQKSTEMFSIEEKNTALICKDFPAA